MRRDPAVVVIQGNRKSQLTAVSEVSLPIDPQLQNYFSAAADPLVSNASAVPMPSDDAPFQLVAGYDLVTGPPPYRPPRPLTVRERIVSVAEFAGIFSTTVQAGALICQGFGAITAGVVSVPCGLAYVAGEAVGTAADIILAADACEKKFVSDDCFIAATAVALPFATNRLLSGLVEGKSIIDIVSGTGSAAWESERQRRDGGGIPSPFPTFPVPFG